MLLAHDVFGGPMGTIPLLRAGVKLDARYRRALGQAGIARIAIDDDETEGIVVRTPLSAGGRLEASTRVGRLQQGARQAFGRGDRFHYGLLGDAEAAASLILDEALEHADGPLSFIAASGPQTHAVRHAIDVVVTGILVARLLFSERGRVVAGARTTDGVDDALRRISLGLLLHDIGHADHDEDVRIEDGEIVEGPTDLLRAHTETAHRSLPHSLISAHAAAVVRDHHERWLGDGPAGLERERIPQFARIAAVADVFDELTSDREGRPGVAPHIAVQAICRGAGRLFDPEVVDIFRRIVAPFPVGTEVRLGDGSLGVVSKVFADVPHTPLVRVIRDPEGKRLKPYEIQLGREAGLDLAMSA